MDSMIMHGMMENKMTTLLKWIFGALLAGLAWLIAVYTDEYFRPYKKVRMGQRK
jgi:hypothetical protein